MSHIRPYLRASTTEQDASRARQQIQDFVTEHAPGQTPAAWYIENESGAKLERPELFRLISDASAGDILLIEQVDRLSRLNGDDWRTLKSKLEDKRIRVVALDLPTSWRALDNKDSLPGDITDSILDAVNRMLLDMLALFARKDYDDRRRRQGQGIATAKAAGKYKGRPEDVARNARLRKMLEAGMSYSDIQAESKASRSTLAAIAKQIRQDREAAAAFPLK